MKSELTAFVIVLGIIVLSSILYYNLYDTDFDYYYIILGLLSCSLLLIGIQLKLGTLTAIGHYVFSLLIIVLIFSNNKYLLGLGIGVVLIAMLTRKMFGGCILKTYQKNVIQFPKFIQKSWDYIFPALLVGFIYKLDVSGYLNNLQLV